MIFRKLIILLGIVLFCKTFGLAGYLNQNDSVTTIQELIVEGKPQYTNANITTYLPSSKQKKAAFDGVQLLQMLGIPQLKISLDNKSISSVDGQTVSLFINGIPATQMDIDAMQTKDVVKVEIIDNSNDPRFGGAAHVVNYVVKEYEFGGYTRIQESNTIFNDFNNQAFIYSKFKYKRLTFDLSVQSSDFSVSHNGSNSKETLNLLGENGPFSLIREQTLKNSRFISHNLPVSLRIVLNNTKYRIINTLSYSFEGVPKYNEFGDLTETSSDITLSDIYHQNITKYARNFSWNGDYYFFMPKQFSLVISPTFKYGNHSRNSKYYTDSGLSETVLNNAGSNVFQGNISLSLTKQFRNNTFELRHVQIMKYTRAKYDGNQDFLSRIREYSTLSNLSYYFKKPIFSFDVHLSLIFHKFSSNGLSEKELTPSISFNIGYSPNPRNKISMYSQYENYASPSADRTDGAIQVEPYMYVKGNPLLKYYKTFTTNINWAYFPINELSFGANVNYRGDYNRHLTVYSDYNNGSAILQTYSNNGNFNNLGTYLSAQLRLLNNSISLGVAGGYFYCNSTGDLVKSFNYGMFSASAGYIIKNFYLYAFYSLPSRSMSMADGSITKGISNYGLSANWGNENWKVSVMLQNPFNNKYLYNTTELLTPVYSKTTESLSLGMRHPLSISIAYIFDYGRRTESYDEISSGSGTDSGILGY